MTIMAKVPDLVNGTVDLAEGMARFGTAEVILAILGMVFLVFGIVMILEMRRDRVSLREKQAEDDRHYKKMFAQTVTLNQRSLDLIEGNREMHIEMGRDLVDMRDGIDKVVTQNDTTHEKLDLAVQLIRHVSDKHDDCARQRTMLERAAVAVEEVKDASEEEKC